MSWSVIGWILIGLTALLLVFFTFINKGKTTYPIRHLRAVEDHDSARVSAIEQGKEQHVVLGNQLLSRRYPGLGLLSLATLPAFLDSETVANGRMIVTASDGTLVVFANQIIQQEYREGFSLALHADHIYTVMRGTSPLSFTAGTLPEIAADDFGSLAMFGNLGPEAALWASAAERNGEPFAAAGSLDSQAALYINMRDLLIGEEAYMLPAALSPNAGKQSTVLTEDLLRALLMVLLAAAAVLKMAGIL